MKEKIICGVLTFAVLLSLTACGTAPAPTPTPTTSPLPTTAPTRTSELVATPRFEKAACPFVLPEGYVQGENVDCGFLVVPEVRTHLPSRAIRLAIGIFHPPGGATRPDPIIVLAGGPGQSLLKVLRYQFEEGLAPFFAAGRDLVIFDQRGVGVSRPALDCPGVEALLLDLLDRELAGRTLTKQEAADRIVEAYWACAAELRQIADLSAYNSAASAADVNDLRLALGYEQINLWGGSYGTRLALEVMRLYPAGLRSVVLESVYPPDVDLYASGPDNFLRALDRLFQSCEASEVCDRAYPALRSDFWRTVERLNAAPVTRPITDTLTGESYLTVFDGDGLEAFVRTLLYETDLRFLLPQLMTDAGQSNFNAIDRIRGALLANRKMMSQGMSFSVQCHEEFPFSSPEEFGDALAPHPELASFYEYSNIGKLAYRVCERWGAGQAEPSANQPVASHIPTLVLAGEFDPVTPPAWGRHAAETLTHSYFFEYPGVGHGVSSVPGCPRQMFLAFIADPAVRPDDTCIANMGHLFGP